MHELNVLVELAASDPGSVDAPLSALVGGAILVTIGGGLLIPLLLKPGTDAAIDMQQRDSKSGRWRKKGE